MLLRGIRAGLTDSRRLNYATTMYVTTGQREKGGGGREIGSENRQRDIVRIKVRPAATATQ